MGTTNILDMNNRIDALEKSFHALKIWTTAEAKSVSGNPITLSDGSARKAEGLVVTLEPKQSGSGTPSPTNVRPITGYTECVVDVKDEEETTHDTATITFGQTVYGGSVDFKSGKVTVTHKLVKGNTITWIDATIASGQRFRSQNVISDAKISQKTDAELKCSKFATNEAAIHFYNYDGICIYSAGQMYVRSLTTTSLSDFETLIADADICYELATPIELTLTPAELELLKGYNYITTNGTTIALDYLPDSLKADILLTVSQLYGSKISTFDEILAGGDTGQVLTKASDDNYDATWATLPTNRTTNKK